MNRFNDGEWTEARMSQFIRSALRKAQWPPKFRAIKKAFIGYGTNPKTGRKCKLHACAHCGNSFPQNGVQADHIDPVIGAEGFQSWDEYIRRLFVDSEGFRVLCKECHRKVTGMARFDVDELGFYRRDAIRTCRALSASGMTSFLESIGLDGSGTITEKLARYTQHLDSLKP
jgi:hypothetical protein